MIALPARVALTIALAVTPPFRTEEPHLRDGNARLEAGAPADALRLYDDAERAAGPHAEIDFARGHAALARGDVAGAADAWRRAAARAPPALASRALQNLGTALAAAGDPDGAVSALDDALSRDPANDDARWNLEVLLRRRAAGKAPPHERAAAQPSDRGGADALDRGDARAGGDARPTPVPARAGDPDASPGAPSLASARDGARREPLSRQDAEALLDALRARERTAPFGPSADRDAGRADAAKDW